MQTISLYLFLALLTLCFSGTPGRVHQEALISIVNPALFPQALFATQAPMVAISTGRAPMILSPLPGQVLQGNIPIVANIAIEGFVAVEISFSYFNNPTDTWFTIYRNDKPAMDATVAQWDTSTITDGVYTLRMIVHLIDGNQHSSIVPGLRVRNYTPIETDTPTPMSLLVTSPVEGLSLSTTPAPLKTPIPLAFTPVASNPAEINRQQVLASVLKGAFAMVGIFALGILFLTIRTMQRRNTS